MSTLRAEDRPGVQASGNAVAPALAGALALALLVTSAFYIVLAVVPFYAHGIHLRSFTEIAGSFVDVKGYPPFSWPALGGIMQGAAMLSVFFVRVFVPVLAAALVATTVVGWRSAPQASRIFWLASALLSSSLSLLAWTSQSIILTWLVD
jgi:hypothetical protein